MEHRTRWIVIPPTAAKNEAELEQPSNSSKYSIVARKASLHAACTNHELVCHEKNIPFTPFIMLNYSKLLAPLSSLAALRVCKMGPGIFAFFPFLFFSFFPVLPTGGAGVVVDTDWGCKNCDRGAKDVSGSGDFENTAFQQSHTGAVEIDAAAL